MAVLKVGIIGAGGIAQSVHIPNYLKSGFDVEIVGIADISLDRANEVAKEFDIPHVYASYEDMLAEVSLDAVSVCVPNKFHADASIAALKAGCHVLCRSEERRGGKEGG